MTRLVLAGEGGEEMLIGTRVYIDAPVMAAPVCENPNRAARKIRSWRRGRLVWRAATLWRFPGLLLL